MGGLTVALGDRVLELERERDEARAEARRLRRLVKQGEGVALNLKACRYGRECPGCVERANKLIAALARPTPKKRKSARRKP